MWKTYKYQTSTSAVLERKERDGYIPPLGDTKSAKRTLQDPQKIQQLTIIQIQVFIQVPAKT